MSRKQIKAKHERLEKQIANKQRRKEAIARGSKINPKQPKIISKSQASHASSNKASKKAREGEAKQR